MSRNIMIRAEQYYESLKINLGTAYSKDDSALCNIELFPIALEMSRSDTIMESLKNQINPAKVTWYLDSLEKFANISSIQNLSDHIRRENLSARYLLTTQVVTPDFINKTLLEIAPSTFTGTISKNSWYDQAMQPVYRTQHFELEQVDSNIQLTDNINQLLSGLSLSGGVVWNWQGHRTYRMTFTSSLNCLFVHVNDKLSSGLESKEYEDSLNIIRNFLDNTLPAYMFYYLVEGSFYLDTKGNLSGRKSLI